MGRGDRLIPEPGPPEVLAREDLLQHVIDLTVEIGDVRALAGAVAELVRRTTRVDVVFVFVLDDDDRQLTLTGATSPFESAVGTVHLPLGEGVSGWVASRGTPVVLADKLDDTRWRRFPQLRGEEFTSMASVPMDTASGEVVGVLNVHTVQRREWDDEDVALLHSTARMVAGAVQTARLLRHLDLRRREQQALCSRLVDVEEHERARLAGELHDGVAQRIAALSFHLSAALEALPDVAEAGAQLRRAAELVDLTAAETRSAVRALRPPLLDDLGLVASLHALSRDVVGVAVDVQVDPVTLTPVQETALYRITQEALHNVIKHAGARNVRVRLRRDGPWAVLEVKDDGRGVLPESPDPGTHGLTSMRDRARLLGADLDVTGRAGQGTTVRVAVPL